MTLGRRQSAEKQVASCRDEVSFQCAPTVSVGYFFYRSAQVGRLADQQDPAPKRPANFPMQSIGALFFSEHDMICHGSSLNSDPPRATCSGTGNSPTASIEKSNPCRRLLFAVKSGHYVPIPPFSRQKLLIE